jgi:hypothetical protein
MYCSVITGPVKGSKITHTSKMHNAEPVSVIGAIGIVDTSSCESASRSLLSSTSKEAEHIPAALTGVVH